MIHGDDGGQKGEDLRAMMGNIAANLMEAVQQGNGELLQELGLGLEFTVGDGEQTEKMAIAATSSR